MGGMSDTITVLAAVNDRRTGHLSHDVESVGVVVVIAVHNADQHERSTHGHTPPRSALLFASGEVAALRSRCMPCWCNSRVTLRTLTPNFSATCLAVVPDL